MIRFRPAKYFIEHHSCEFLDVIFWGSEMLFFVKWLQQKERKC